MSNVIQLRRALSIGDKVRIGNALVYTISRIDGRSLWGYFEGDKVLNKERWITKDYKKSVKRLIDGEEIALHVTHMDGRHIQ